MQRMLKSSTIAGSEGVTTVLEQLPVSAVAAAETAAYEAQQMAAAAAAVATAAAAGTAAYLDLAGQRG